MNEELKVIISAEIAKFKKEIEQATKETEKFKNKGKEKFKEFNEAAQKVGDVTKKALKVAATAIIGATTALLALGASTKEYRQHQALLATSFQVAGGSAEMAKETYNDLYRVLGDSGKATEAAQHLAQLTTEQEALSEWTTICQGVYATFSDSLPIESLTEAANETAKTGELTGALADALNWAGINEEEFKDQLFLCNDEAEREALIRKTLSGLYSEAAANYEKTGAAVLEQNEAQAKLNEAMAELGAVTAPIMTMLTELGTDVLAQLTPHFKDFVDKYGDQIADILVDIGKAIGDVLTWISDNWDIVKGVAGVVLAIAAALAIVSTALTVYNTVMAITTVVSAPIIAIILAIVAAVALLIIYWDEIKAATEKAWNAIVGAIQSAIDWIVGIFNSIISWVRDNWQGLLLLLVNPFAGAFKLLYDNCEGFRTTINNLFNGVKDTFTKIGSTIKEKFNAAADTVKGIIEKIKGFFKFEWSLPKLKVPKFSVTPAGWEIGDLLKGVIPKLGVTWNAKGGVFEKPTLFNYGNSLQGLGENGAEAVVPLENNLEWLDKLASMLGERLGNNQPIILQVDGVTLAKTSIKSINQLTKQTGRLDLVLA